MKSIDWSFNVACIYTCDGGFTLGHFKSITLLFCFEMLVLFFLTIHKRHPNVCYYRFFLLLLLLLFFPFFFFVSFYSFVISGNHKRNDFKIRFLETFAQPRDYSITWALFTQKILKNINIIFNVFHIWNGFSICGSMMNCLRSHINLTIHRFLFLLRSFFLSIAHSLFFLLSFFFFFLMLLTVRLYTTYI